ncbi:MAG TPA: hypothetical protein ENJ31_06645 [Anaerolineae bacterium]|nr:hypothetical protein [Anaerolineae bacterium]
MTFKTWDGYTYDYPAIIDTGAPVSIIPFRIWGQCAIKQLGQDTIRGLVDRDECDLEVTAAQVTCALTDGASITDDIRIRADLAPTSEMPLILGFKDLLERAELCCNYQSGVAYLEI